jgi:aromatic-L-amino-acid/L-tryptophan decarboxylase
MDWLRQMLDLPNSFVGVIQDTASTATLVALLSARERASAGFRETGSSPGRLTVYTSTQAHSSVPKGVKLAGYGLEQLRWVPVDQSYAMRPDALERAIAEDVEAGFRPACVVATIGTTSSTAIDPIRSIAEICRRHGAWLHVDAAYAGTAAIVPEFRDYFNGVELADSFLFNPHKWMLVNFDCSAYFVRNVDALLQTFRISPEYLRTAQDQQVVNYRDWGIQLGRRFRALKLWFVLRSYGVEGLRALVRRHIELARELAERIQATPDFELMAPVAFGLVCFRFHPEGMSDGAALNQLNRDLLSRVNASRRVYLTHTELEGKFVIRLVIGQRLTSRTHVDEAWLLIQQAARSYPFEPELSHQD